MDRSGHEGRVGHIETTSPSLNRGEGKPPDSGFVVKARGVKFADGDESPSTSQPQLGQLEGSSAGIGNGKGAQTGGKKPRRLAGDAITGESSFEQLPHVGAIPHEARLASFARGVTIPPLNLMD